MDCGEIVRKKVGWGIKLSFRPVLHQLANWKRRRFELTQTQFLYSAEDGTLKGKIPRSSIVLAESIENYSLPHLRGRLTPHYPFAIRLYIGQQSFFFCVATDQARQSWISAFNNDPVIEPIISGRKRYSTFYNTPLSTPVSSHSDSKIFTDSQTVALFKSLSREGVLEKCESFSMEKGSLDLDDSEDCLISIVTEDNEPVDFGSISFLRQGSERANRDEVSIDMFLWNMLQQYVDPNGDNSFKDNKLLRTTHKNEGTWNESFQNSIERLFIPQTLGEFQKRNQYSEKKLELLEFLQDLEKEFSHVASSIFSTWIKENRFIEEQKTEEFFTKNGIKFCIPKSFDPITVNSFRKKALQSRQEIIQIWGRISQLYDMFLSTAPSGEQVKLAMECIEIEKKIESLSNNNNSSNNNEIEELKEKLKNNLNHPLFPDNEQIHQLPLYFPLYCIIDYLGYPAIAIADPGNISRTLNDLGEEIKQDIASFVSATLFQRDITDIENAGRPKLMYSSIDSRCYLSASSHIAPLEDISYWENDVSDNYWKFRNPENFHIRPELYHRYISSSNSNLSPTEYLHRIIIPSFAEELCDSIETLLSNTLCTRLHRAGINLRHIGRVYTILDDYYQYKPLFALEMAARALKSSFFNLCRECKSLAKCNEIWNNWESILLQNELWWKDLGMEQIIGLKYSPKNLSIPFESMDRVTLLLRVQSLVGMHEEGSLDDVGFTPVLHRLHVFSLSQVIHPNNYYSAASKIPLIANSQLYYHCIQYNFHTPTTISNNSQKSLALLGIADGLQKLNDPPIAIIYEVLQRCLKSVDELLTLQKNSLIGYLIKGIASSKLYNLLKKRSNLLLSCQETFCNQNDLLLDSLCYFQIVMMLVQSNSISTERSFQYIEPTEAFELASQYWNNKAQEIMNIESNTDPFSLALSQLNVAGFDTSNYFNGNECTDESEFLKNILKFEEDSILQRTSFYIIFLLCISDPESNSTTSNLTNTLQNFVLYYSQPLILDDIQKIILSNVGNSLSDSLLKCCQ